MANLVPTPVCAFEQLRSVVKGRYQLTPEQIQQHPGKRFDLAGLTTPVFDVETFNTPKSLNLAGQFEDLGITAIIGSGNPFYDTRVYLGETVDILSHEHVAVRYFAVKTRQALDCDQEDFARELSLKLKHSHLTTLIDAGSLADGRRYGVMQLVEGISLKQGLQLLSSYALNPDKKSVMARKRNEPLKIRPNLDKPIGPHDSIRHIEKVISKILTKEQRQLLKIQLRQEMLHSMLKVGEALCYIGGRGLVHRDIKPANLLLVGSRDTIDPQIIDFGTCCAPFVTLGTKNAETHVNHMHSPETVFGGLVDIRHDFFCLGAILYCLATSSTPFKGQSAEEEMDWLSSNSPSTTGDAELDAIILPMLAIEPKQRLFGTDFVGVFSRYVRSHTLSEDGE